MIGYWRSRIRHLTLPFQAAALLSPQTFFSRSQPYLVRSTTKSLCVLVNGKKPPLSSVP